MGALIARRGVKPESETGHADGRTHEETIRFAKEAQAHLLNTGKETSVFGIKGMTWSYFFPKFNAIKGVAIDYMHCILLVVMKMLMTLWFDSAYKMMPWYTGSNIKAIDDKVQNFKLPNIITRLPRSIKGDLSHWNTSE